MCSVIILNHHVKDIPLIIAANRDENIARKFETVQVLDKDDLIIGSKDSRGGSALAANKFGLFATITNQGVSLQGKRSRGLLILDVLKCKTLDEMIAFVEKIDATLYNGFNLVFGNNKSVYVAYSYILHSVAIREVPVGVSLITSDITFPVQNANRNYVHQKIDSLKNANWLHVYKKLKVILSSVDNGVRFPIKKAGRCTVSSSVLAFDDLGLSRFKFFDRTITRPKRKENDPFVPRYHDFIELMREKIESEESYDLNDEVEEVPAETMSEKEFRKELRAEFAKSLYGSYDYWTKTGNR